jgi:hypothetical protein
MIATIRKNIITAARGVIAPDAVVIECWICGAQQLALIFHKHQWGKL